MSTINICCFHPKSKSFFYALQLFDIFYSLFKIIFSILVISNKVYTESSDLYDLGSGLLVFFAVTISILIKLWANTMSSCYHKFYAFVRFFVLIIALCVYIGNYCFGNYYLIFFDTKRIIVI